MFKLVRNIYYNCTYLQKLYKIHWENIWQRLQGKNVLYKYQQQLDSTKIIFIKYNNLTSILILSFKYIFKVTYINISNNNTIPIGV